LDAPVPNEVEEPSTTILIGDVHWAFKLKINAFKIKKYRMNNFIIRNN
jgi:hypothetical protein